MKESEKIHNECLELINDLKNCMTKNGWKGRYLGYCEGYIKQFDKCKLREFEAKRKENKTYKRKKF